MEFTLDNEGKELLLKEGTHQVMMEWEKPYMEACIQALKPTGDVLEIGYGLGYSANAIQTFTPRSHTIIEYDQTVLERGKVWAQGLSGVQFIHSTWQEIIPTLGMFDAIFFDDYPLDTVTPVNTPDLPEVQQQEISIEEIHGFISLLENKEMHIIEPEFLENFIHNLDVSKPQRDLLFYECTKRGLLKEKDRPEIVVSKRCDRLSTFLELALPHLKTNGRFSCYLEDINTLYDNEYIFNEIICSPSYTLSEQTIPVTPSKNCTYFTKDTAVVMTIQKDPTTLA